jgi:hypothetical protein
MKTVGEMTQAELGAYVQSHLGEKGIDVVLSGGAVVAIYTSGKYVSRDLDLVNRYSARRSTIKAAMQELGFHEVGRHFQHPDSEFFVEFPPGPLSFGEEFVTSIDELKTETGVLRIISPTDCVKDRLAWYYHYGDRQCLTQAILVSSNHRVDIDAIRRWSEGEGKLGAFKEIRPQLEGS